jgi:hypothetical protein
MMMMMMMTKMKMLEKYLELDDTWVSLVHYFEIAKILYVWLHFEDLDLTSDMQDLLTVYVAYLFVLLLVVA